MENDELNRKLPFDWTRAGTPEAAIAETTAYRFWLTLTRRDQRRQPFVGANIRPPLHMLPKAPWPERWVPPPRTRGIRATARPVPHDSAEVWWPRKKFPLVNQPLDWLNLFLVTGNFIFYQLRWKYFCKNKSENSFTIVTVREFTSRVNSRRVGYTLFFRNGNFCTGPADYFVERIRIFLFNYAK